VYRVQSTWTSDAARVHGGPKAARTKRAVVHHRLEAHERSGSPMFAGNGWGGRGRCGEADGELTRARAMMVRWWKEIIVWALESGS
jgi:hypothetical protein